MNIKNTKCPHCGKTINTPLNLIPYSELKKIGGDVLDSVPYDHIMIEHNNAFGGVISSDKNFKQLTFEDDDIPEILKKYITDDNKLTYQIGSGDLDQKACPHCHFNVTPLFSNDINNVINILLIGVTGSSKTMLASSIFKLISEVTLKGKDEKFELATPVKSFEFEYYSEIAANFPVVPSATYHENGFFNRQPLFYCFVNNTLLIFHDYPGEALKGSEFNVPDNSIPVYLYDYTGDVNNTEQIPFLMKKIQELHDGGQKYTKEVLSFVKSDLLSSQLKKSIMIKPYKETEFTNFTGLLSARRMIQKGFKNSVFEKLREYSRIVDVNCVAALGCPTHEVKRNGRIYYELDNTWTPEFLFDFLFTLSE